MGDFPSIVVAGIAKKALTGLGIGYTVGGLPHLSAAVNRVRSRVGRAKWIFEGDSTSNGQGAGVTVGTGTGTNAFTGGNASLAKSRPSQLAALLAAAGIPTRADSVCGIANVGGGTQSDYMLFNPQVTLGAGWTTPSASSGCYFVNNTDTSSFVFTPQKAADAFDITIFRADAGDTITVTDASGTLATINTATAGSYYQTTTVTRAQASRLPISIQRTGVGTVANLSSIVPYNRDLPSLEIINMACGGSKASNWASTASFGLGTYSASIGSRDATTINLGLNDALANSNTPGSEPVTAYQGYLQTCASSALALGGDLIMMTPHRTQSSAQTGYDLTDAHRTAIAAVAAQYGTPNLPQIDLSIFSINNGNLIITNYYDIIHLTSLGYGTLATYEAAKVLAVL